MDADVANRSDFRLMASATVEFEPTTPDFEVTIDWCVKTRWDEG